MMKLTSAVCGLLVVVMLISSGALAAEHQMEGDKPMGCCQAGQPGEGGDWQPMMRRGTKGQGMMGSPMMGMMCPMMQQQMMGGMMGPAGMGMLGMMSGGKDPKAMGRMLQMRGEILKAVGEVLLKYGNAMAEEGK